jgi:Holliday junction DNA helicase RuvA
MIDFIHGRIAYHTTECVVVEARGVGYRIFCVNPYEWAVEEEVRIYTHPVIREDAQILYGFSDQTVRDCFRLLLGVSGIGPKVALNIVGAGSLSSLVDAVEKEDLRFLTRLPGIGKKTAQRLVLELKDKLKKADWVQGINTGETAVARAPMGPVSREAIDALMSLGYNEEEASLAVDEARRAFGEEEPSLDEWIRRALQVSMKG